MDTKKPHLFFNWSSGKDSSFALYKLIQQNDFQTLNFINDSWHGNKMDWNAWHARKFIETISLGHWTSFGNNLLV